jgi:hypothetical protein
MTVEVGMFYKHVTTGTWYKVRHVARAAWDSEQLLVVYTDSNTDAGDIWVRSLTEFTDGRFTDAVD